MKIGIELTFDPFFERVNDMFIESIDLYLFLVLLLLFIYAIVVSSHTVMFKTYLGLHFLMMLWPLGQFAIPYAPNPFHKWLWVNISFFGFSFLGFGWLMFSLAITEQYRFLKGKILSFLAAPAVISALLITTNPLHYLFARPENGGWAIRTYGLVFWFFLFSTVVYVVSATVIMIRNIHARPEQLIKKQVRLIYWGLASPILLGLLDTLINVVLYPRFGLVPGLTSLGIAISATCFVVAITRFDLIKILDFARREIVENIPLGVIVLDNRNNIVEANKAAKYYLSRRLKTIKGTHINDLFIAVLNYTTDKDSFQHFFGECMEAPLKVLKKEVCFRYPFRRHFNINFSPVIGSNGFILGRILTFDEITHIKNMVEEINTKNKQLEKMAITDQLTGVYNKTYMMRYLVQDIDLAIRDTFIFSLIIFDFDHFKNINDAYGHQAGDLVLKKTIEVIRRNIRQSDVLARYGGEEFIIFTPNSDLHCAVDLAERLKKAVASTQIKFSKNIISVTISAGVSSFNSGNISELSPALVLDRMISEADNALYLAKANGRNCVAASSVNLKSFG